MSELELVKMKFGELQSVTKWLKHDSGVMKRQLRALWTTAFALACVVAFLLFF